MSDPFPPQGFQPVASAVEGIQVFAPAAPETAAHQPVVEFKCPQCGATTAYSVPDGGLSCTHCGYYEPATTPVVGKAAEQFEFTVETLQRAAHGWGEARNEVECQSCGARTSLATDVIASACPFCGSNKVIQRAAPQDVLRPRFLIPFKIEPQRCASLVQSWLASSWMTPAGLRQLANLPRFTGVYLPFWTFDAVTSATWKAEVGHLKTERYYENGQWKERTVVVWRWESGRVQLTIDDLIVEGSARLSRLLMSKLKDYNLGELTPYDPKYLAGFQARAYDVPLEQAWEIARAQMREQTRQACYRQASTSMVRNFSMELDFSQESWRYLLLPMYVAAYRYQGKTYQVMLNGQTGKVAGQRPVDWVKVGLIAGAIAAPGLLLSLAGLLTLWLGGVGAAIGGVGLFLLLLAVVIDAVILVQALRMDDI